MKKHIILILVLGLTAFSASAQNTFRMSYQIAVPMGETADFIDVAAYRGFSFEYYYALQENLHLGLEVGWNFFNKDYDRATYEFENGAATTTQWRFKHVVPMLVNTMYDIKETDKLTFYGKFGVGPYFINDEAWVGMLTIAENKALFGMAPGLGFTVNVSESFGFNFAAEYEFIVNGQLQLDDRAHSHYWNFKMGIQFGK